VGGTPSASIQPTEALAQIKIPKAFKHNVFFVFNMLSSTPWAQPVTLTHTGPPACRHIKVVHTQSKPSQC
jgi:hypothetical protein